MPVSHDQRGIGQITLVVGNTSRCPDEISSTEIVDKTCGRRARTDPFVGRDMVLRRDLGCGNHQQDRVIISLTLSITEGVMEAIRRDVMTRETIVMFHQRRSLIAQGGSSIMRS